MKFYKIKADIVDGHIYCVCGQRIQVVRAPMRIRAECNTCGAIMEVEENVAEPLPNVMAEILREEGLASWDDLKDTPVDGPITFEFATDFACRVQLLAFHPYSNILTAIATCIERQPQSTTLRYVDGSPHQPAPTEVAHFHQSWNIQSRETIEPGLKEILIHRCVALDPNRAVLAFVPQGYSHIEDNHVYLSDLQSNTLAKIKHKHNIDAINFSGNGRFIATGADTEMVIWDMKRPKKDSFQCNALKTPIKIGKLAVSSDAEFAAVVGDGRYMGSKNMLFVMRTSGAIFGRRLWTPKGCELADFVAFSPSAEVLAIANSRSLQLWDYQNKSHRHELKGHEESITAIGFSHDGRRVVSGDRKGFVRLWNAESGVCVAQHDAGGAIAAVACSSDGTFFASQASFGHVMMWSA